MYSNMIQFYNTYMYAHIYSFSGSFPIYVITKYRVQISVLYNSVLLSHSVMSNSCDPMDCSTPGFPVRHELPEFTKTHIHWVGDAIQPSHPLSSPSPPVFNLSHHKGLFQWVSYSHQVAKVLEFQLQHQSFQWMFRTGWISLQSKGLSRVFSNTTVQKHQFFGVQASLWSNFHIHTWLLEKTIALTKRTFVGKVISLLFNMLSRLVIAFLLRS